MKLFNNYEAFNLVEENKILITKSEFIYYVYNQKYNHWHKYSNAGNVSITTINYGEVTKEEIIQAMNGVFPSKQTDFSRLCHPSELWNIELIDLLLEDYRSYMSYEIIYDTVSDFINASYIVHKSYLKLRELFDKAQANKTNHEQLLNQIKELSFDIIGKDIFKKEIGIVDGHDYTSYYWIKPVRVIDYSDTQNIDNVAEMRSLEISIEELDVNDFLYPFLVKNFNSNLKANKNRIDMNPTDEEQVEYITDFGWWLVHNFYTFEDIQNIINDINDTIDALSVGRKNEYTEKLKKTNTEIDLIIDFYQRFVYRMKYMMKIGKENGFDLISVMHP